MSVAVHSVHETTPDFLARFISYFDGEKDPRNLMIVFSILKVPMTEWNVGTDAQVSVRRSNHCRPLPPSFLPSIPRFGHLVKLTDQRTYSTLSSTISQSLSGHHQMIHTESRPSISRIGYGIASHQHQTLPLTPSPLYLTNSIPLLSIQR